MRKAWLIATFLSIVRGFSAQNRVGVPSRFVGSFRADGLLVPVWELTDGTSAVDTEAAAAEFGQRLTAALTVDAPLTSEERRARAGLQNRQITLR